MRILDKSYKVFYKYDKDRNLKFYQDTEKDGRCKLYSYFDMEKNPVYFFTKARPLKKDIVEFAQFTLLPDLVCKYCLITDLKGNKKDMVEIRYKNGVPLIYSSKLSGISKSKNGKEHFRFKKEHFGFFDFLNVIKDGFEDYIIDPTLSVFSTISTNVQKAFNTVIGPIKDVFNSIKNGIMDVVDKIGDFVTETIPGTVNTVINTVGDQVNIVKDSVTSGFKTVQDGVQSVGNKVQDFGNMAINTVKDGINTAISQVDNQANIVKDGVVSGFNTVKDGVVSISNQAADFGEMAFNTVKDGVNTAISQVEKQANNVKDGIVSGFNTVQSSVTSIANEVKDFGEQIYSNVESGVKTAIDGTVYVFNQVKDGVMGLIKQIEDLDIPGKIMWVVDQVKNTGELVGNKIWEGLQTGFDYAKYGLEYAFNEAKDKVFYVKDQIVNISQMVYDKIEYVIEKISSGFYMVTSVIEEQGSKIINKIKEGAEPVVNTTWNMLKVLLKIVEWIANTSYKFLKFMASGKGPKAVKIFIVFFFLIYVPIYLFGTLKLMKKVITK